MPKRTYFHRYDFIIKKLRKNREASFEEISDYLQQESEYLGENLTISKRTFQRDLNEIRSIFSIDIRCNNYHKYYIAEDTEEHHRLLETFDTFNFLKVAEKYSPHVNFESRKPQGTEHFFGLLHAIKNRFIIRFTYFKFWDNENSQRTAEPYLLKESKNRWYVLAKDDKTIKTFGLDRISDLEITREKFEKPLNFNPKEIFKNCFGIIHPTDCEPEEIILRFEPTQGKYIKSFPLHDSQKIILENENELRISLHIYITDDFIFELLSHGDLVKVVSPKNLQKAICKIYDNARRQYS